MNIKPVIVGVDDIRPSALRFAATEAMNHERPLRVIHCMDPLITAGADAMAPGRSDLGFRNEVGEQVLDAARKVVEETQPSVEAVYSLEWGAPTRVLAEQANQAAIVVVGTDTAGWADRLFGGRVAEYLVKRSPAPVAIVPESTLPSPSSGGVFVALETGPLATEVLRFAFGEASHHGTDLHVIHTVPVGSDHDVVSDERQRIAIQLSGWSEKYQDVKVARTLVFDRPDQGCLRATEEAGLLVLGRSAGPKFTMPWSHPILTQIARHAHCPCVVVPLGRDSDQAPHEFGGARHTAPF